MVYRSSNDVIAQLIAMQYNIQEEDVEGV